MDVIAWVISLILDIISTLGYPGVIFFMILESMCLPVPSEVVLPFAGALAAEGDMNWILVGLAGTLGCLIGSVVAYYVGLKGGEPLLRKYGKYILINERHIDSSERWFKKYGDAVVFFSRLLPVIRTFISLPAGMYKMNFPRFVFLTIAGSLPWCLALSYAGYLLGSNWRDLEGDFRAFEVVIVVAILVGLVSWIAYKWMKKTKAHA